MYFDDIGMREKASSIGFSYKSFEPPLNILIRLFSILRYSVVLGTLYKILGEILLDRDFPFAPGVFSQISNTKAARAENFLDCEIIELITGG